MQRTYLDHTATTPLDPRVLDVMLPFFSGTFGNASSVHWYGQQARAALERSREMIARAIGAEPGEIFFTSGGTESDNLAIKGVFRAACRKGKDHLVTSSAEHHAVLEPCELLAEEGARATVLPPDNSGRVDPGMVRDAITDRTCLVSIMHANNEVGTISPLAAIAEVARARGVLVHSDAVQTVGKLPVSVKDLGIDLMTFSAHKIYGPKGIGALFVRRGTELETLFHGGGQERGKRPGTENVPLVVGFAKAVEIAVGEMEQESARLKNLRDSLEERIQRRFPEVMINGHPSERLPHILNISFDSRRIALEGEMLLMNMDLRGIAVSSGSACTSGSMQASHVLLAMGRDPATARATVRFSFGKSNTEEDVDTVVDALEETIKQMRG
jgi:cysteine desulfurase